MHVSLITYGTGSKCFRFTEALFKTPEYKADQFQVTAAYNDDPFRSTLMIATNDIDAARLLAQDMRDMAAKLESEIAKCERLRAFQRENEAKP